MSFEPESGVAPPVAPPGEAVHPLVRPTTVRGLRIGFAVVLAALVLGDLLIHPHAGFGIDGTFGFYAWYGLGTCVAMVLFAKGLGVFLKRPDTWYDDTSEAASGGARAATPDGTADDAPARSAAPGAGGAARRTRPAR